MPIKYKRVLLKLSGEALAGEKKFGIDYNVISSICESIKKCVDLGDGGSHTCRSYGNAGDSDECAGTGRCVGNAWG